MVFWGFFHCSQMYKLVKLLLNSNVKANFMRVNSDDTVFHKEYVNAGLSNKYVPINHVENNLMIKNQFCLFILFLCFF